MGCVPVPGASTHKYAPINISNYSIINYFHVHVFMHTIEFYWFLELVNMNNHVHSAPQ